MRFALLSMLSAIAIVIATAETRAGDYAPVNGLRIYYEIHGTGRPLVLLHGGGSTIETSFGAVLPQLAKTRQVIAFEQQGHGHTADVDRPFSFEQSADDTAALLKYLKIEQADFIGYSNGGSIAMAMAIRHPTMVRKVVAVSAMTKRDGFPPEFWEGMKNATLESMPAELKEAYLKTSPHPDKLQSFHDKSVQRMLNFKDWPDEVVRAIAAPTMVLIGDADVIRPEHAVEMLRTLPHAQLAILPGTDHMQIVKRPDLLLPIILPFLDAPLPTQAPSRTK